MPSTSATPDRAASARFTTLGQLVDLFAARADRPAVYTLGRELETLTYGQLARDVVRTAHGLAARGVGPGRMVLLWGPNSPAWVTVYFAVVHSGATAIPFDHQATAASAADIVRHASPALLATTAAHFAELEALGPLDTECVLLDADPGHARSWRTLGSAPAGALPDVGPSVIASLLYTSGTTGTPKAVPLTHANLTANLAALLEARLVGADARVLLPLPLHHTYPFTVGLLTPLATGAAVVFPAGVTGPEIARAARETRATALLAVPRLCEALWNAVASGAAARGPVAKRLFGGLLGASHWVRRMTGLRVGRWLFRAVHARLGGRLTLIGCGGAKLEPELARRLEAIGFKVLTGYGLTETSPVLTFNSHRHSRAGTEGRPLKGVELKIAPSAEQTHGEILARGPSVFAGYWHNPEETAAAFAAEGWFRTGDLGWLDPRGYLHVAGRSKELIVLRDGKKIFPESLEKIYAESPLLHEVAILEHDGALVGLIVPDEQSVRERGSMREASLLREELTAIAARLPPYQRLADYRLTRAALPRTQLGKLRRHLLPQLYREAARGEAPAPAEPTAADRQALDSALGRELWTWLRQRYPDRPLTLDTSPQLDLQIDSLEWVTITMDLEQRFDRVLSGEAVSRILTLRDLLRELAAAPSAAAAEVPAQGAFEPPGALLRAVGAVLFAITRIVMRLAFRLRVEGTERLPQDRPLVFTPNHTSYLDPLALAAALPWKQLRRTYWAGWVGVLFRGPLSRAVSRVTQVFPVDPDRDLASAIRIARRLVGDGYSVVWFPEGYRSPTGDVKPFQVGVGVLLEQTGAIAVPTAIRGAFEAWPRQRRWPRLTPITVIFGPPLAAPDRAPASERPPARWCESLEQAVRQLVGMPAPPTPDGRSPRGGTRASEDTDAEPPQHLERAMSQPEQWREVLKNGSEVSIRPIRPDDVLAHAAFIEQLSAPSKHFLFLGGISKLSDTALRRLCDPDDTHDMAYVAIADKDGRPREVGICRYAGADPVHGAEISVAVADDWQHRGLGRRLLNRLIDHARERGVKRLYSIDAVNNDRMRELARHLGFGEQPDPDDVHQVVYFLDLDR